MTCECKKGATCADCLADADLSLDSRVSPAEQIRQLAAKLEARPEFV